MAEIQLSANLIATASTDTRASMAFSLGANIKRKHPPPELANQPAPEEVVVFRPMRRP
jgi:hypothetical protein